MFGLFGKLKDFLIPTLRNQQHKTSSFASGEWRPNKKRRAASREDVTGMIFLVYTPPCRAFLLKLYWKADWALMIQLSSDVWTLNNCVSSDIYGGIIFCMVLGIDVGILRYSARVFCTLFLLGVSHEIAMNADVFLALPKSRWTKRGARAIRVDWGCEFW